jgi:hypothetical protein
MPIAIAAAMSAISVGCFGVGLRLCHCNSGESESYNDLNGKKKEGSIQKNGNTILYSK